VQLVCFITNKFSNSLCYLAGRWMWRAASIARNGRTVRGSSWHWVSAAGTKKRNE